MDHYSLYTSRKGIEVCTQGSWPTGHPSKVYPGFLGMKLQGISLLPLGWNVSPSQSYPQHFIRLSWQFTATYLYSEVDWGTRRVKWFEFNTKRTQHNAAARFEPKPLEPESSTPIIRYLDISPIHKYSDLLLVLTCWKWLSFRKYIKTVLWCRIEKRSSELCEFKITCSLMVARYHICIMVWLLNKEGWALLLFENLSSRKSKKKKNSIWGWDVFRNACSNENSSKSPICQADCAMKNLTSICKNCQFHQTDFALRND